MNQPFVAQLKAHKAKYLKAVAAIDALLAIEGEVEPALPTTTPVADSPSIDTGHSIENSSTGKQLGRFSGGRRAVLKVIKESGRFLHIQEVVDTLTGPGGQLQGYERGSVIRAVRNALQGLQALKQVVNIKHDSQAVNTFWGEPSWVLPGSDPKAPLPDKMYSHDHLK